MKQTNKGTIDQLIEEAQIRFCEKFVKNQNGFEVVQPLHIDEFNTFLEVELRTIATKSADEERKNILKVIGSIRGITNSLYEVQQKLEKDL